MCNLSLIGLQKMIGDGQIFFYQVWKWTASFSSLEAW